MCDKLQMYNTITLRTIMHTIYFCTIKCCNYMCVYSIRHIGWYVKPTPNTITLYNHTLLCPCFSECHEFQMLGFEVAQVEQQVNLQFTGTHVIVHKT